MPEPEFDTPPPDENGPTYRLPERPPLDPVSEVALRILEALDKQLANLPDGIAVVVDPRPLAEAALAGIGDIPRVPTWTGDPRTIGGRHMGTPGPDNPQEAEVRLDTVDGQVRLTVEFDQADAELYADGQTSAVRVHVEPVDAEGWLLAGLGACAAARAET